MNLKVKFRVNYSVRLRLIVRRERVADYFELDFDSPYYVMVALR